MAMPLEITFRRMDPSDALRQNIEKHAARLERFAGDILSCDVVVEAVDHSHRKGNLYNVHIHLTLPGTTLDAGHTRPDDHSHEDPYVAARDAFDAMRRRLEDFIRKRDDARRVEAPKRAMAKKAGDAETGQ